MINWVALVLLMREVAIAIAMIISFLGCGVLLFRERRELSSKVYLPWEKEEKKRAKLEEKTRR